MFYPNIPQMLKALWELFRGASPRAWAHTSDYAQGGCCTGLQEPGWALFLADAVAGQQGEQACHSPRPKKPQGEGWVEAEHF